MGRIRSQEATEYARAPRSSTGSPMAAARIASGLTQQQLADMLGVSRADVNQWETGAWKLPPEFADPLRDITGYIQSSENENITEARLHVGRLIQARREALGLSRRALADLLGLKNQRSVYLWESGKYLPLPCTLERIACALSCRPDDLGGTPRAQVSPRIEAIRQMRLDAGLSYRQLSQKTGIADTYISLIERNGVCIPTDKTVALIARACGCTPADYGLDIPADAGLQQPPARQYRFAGFGDYLKSCREREGLSRQAIAERLGVVKSLISQYERGLVLPPATRIPALSSMLCESAEQMLAMRQNAIQADSIRKIANRKGNTMNTMNSKTKPRDTRNDSPIARARLASGLTQAQLAEKVGVLPNQIGNWERGVRNPKLDALRRIAAALGCKIDDLA